jgi:hypothetical protein
MANDCGVANTVAISAIPGGELGRHTCGNRGHASGPPDPPFNIPRGIFYSEKRRGCKHCNHKSLRENNFRQRLLTAQSPFCQGEFELFQFANFPPTIQITQNAENDASRRLVVLGRISRVFRTSTRQRASLFSE